MPRARHAVFLGHGDLLARVSDAGGGDCPTCTTKPAGWSLTNENGVQAQFRYDLLDRLVEETGFDGRRQRYRYNAADELIAREDADGRETTYAYDRDGRLASIRVPATEHAPALVERYRWLPTAAWPAPAGRIARCATRTTRSVTCAWKARYMPTVGSTASSTATTR